MPLYIAFYVVQAIDFYLLSNLPGPLLKNLIVDPGLPEDGIIQPVGGSSLPAWVKAALRRSPPQCHRSKPSPPRFLYNSSILYIHAYYIARIGEMPGWGDD